MPRPKRKTKAEDLARVRNNQRKCRQRRRDYVNELESRIASYEQNAAQAGLRLRATEEKLHRENEVLRSLLKSCGLDSRIIDHHLIGDSQGESNLNPRTKTSLISLAANTELSALGFHTGSTAFQSSNDNSEIVGSLTTMTGVADPGLMSLLGQESALSPYSPLATSLDLMPNIYTPYFLDEVPESNPCEIPSLTTCTPTVDIATVLDDAVLQDSTLCAVAIQIVRHCNKKNVNMLELDARLRPGYRNAKSPLEGCRVDNWVLLSVLAEIIQ